VRPFILIIALVLTLSACDAGDPPPLPVGSEIEGGFIVNESDTFRTIEACTSYARKVQKKKKAGRVIETVGQGIYTGVFQAGDEAVIQICDQRGRKTAAYFSATK